MKDLGSPTYSRKRPERPPAFITSTPTLIKGTALDLKGWGRIVLQLKERKPQCPTEREKGKSMKLTEGKDNRVWGWETKCVPPPCPGGQGFAAPASCARKNMGPVLWNVDILSGDAGNLGFI